MFLFVGRGNSDDGPEAPRWQHRGAVGRPNGNDGGNTARVGRHAEPDRAQQCERSGTASPRKGFGPEEETRRNDGPVAIPSRRASGTRRPSGGLNRSSGTGGLRTEGKARATATPRGPQGSLGVVTFSTPAGRGRASGRGALRAPQSYAHSAGEAGRNLCEGAGGARSPSRTPLLRACGFAADAWVSRQGRSKLEARSAGLRWPSWHIHSVCSRQGRRSRPSFGRIGRF